MATPAPDAGVAMGDGGAQREVMRRLAPTRRSRAQNRRSLVMEIRYCAYAYRRWVRWERGTLLTVIFDPLVEELGPAEALALAEDELHCVG